MSRTLKRSGAITIVFLLNLILFVVFTMPFKLWTAVSEITQMRPASALTPVLGMIFGWPAALGCAAGNMICDLASGYELSYSLLDSLLQVLYAMVAYHLWKRLNKERGGREFRLDSVSRVLKFCLALTVNAVLIVVCTALLNHSYDVSSLVSIDNLYLFINNLDAGLLFGAPFMILGHLLQNHLMNLRSGRKDKVVQFSMNERMILNTIITGLGICTLVGASVYITDKYGSGEGIGLIGRIYLFETLAFNMYFALSLGMMRYTETKISRPVERLAHIAGNYYADHATDEQRSQMVTACEAYAGDSTEVGDLARSYISMVQDLGSYIDNLRTVLAEKERINAELNLASDIQAHMLPCIFPPFPDRKEFDLYAIMNPAKEVGGDFYDFFLIGEDRLAVVVADVSGKGVPAALFMVITKTLLKNHAQLGMEPGEVFEKVNNLLCDGNDAGLFVTAWMGILDIPTGDMAYVNAGHNPPLVLHAGGQFDYLRGRSGFVLAGMEDMVYRQNTLHMDPGDRLFLYTDGVTEATDAGEQLYGEDRLQAYLNGHAGDETEAVLHGLRADIDAFVGAAPQFDDITMLLLDYHGIEKTCVNGQGIMDADVAAGDEAPAVDETSLTRQTFPATDEALPEVLAFVEGTLEQVDCPMGIQTSICVAMEELFVNVAHYAYPEGAGSVEIGIGVAPDTRVATFVITDTGVPFNPLEREDPDVTRPAAEREIGGLGIYIVKRTMDTMQYAREGDTNRLTMTKQL